jgi:hypothetical protein
MLRRPGQALFWETYSIETIYVRTWIVDIAGADRSFQGLSVGRPTGTFLSNISCPFPPEEDDDTQPFVHIFPGCP